MGSRRHPCHARAPAPFGQGEEAWRSWLMWMGPWFEMHVRDNKDIRFVSHGEKPFKVMAQYAIIGRHAEPRPVSCRLFETGLPGGAAPAVAPPSVVRRTCECRRARIKAHCCRVRAPCDHRPAFARRWMKEGFFAWASRSASIRRVNAPALSRAARSRRSTRIPTAWS